MTDQPMTDAQALALLAEAVEYRCATVAANREHGPSLQSALDHIAARLTAPVAPRAEVDEAMMDRAFDAYLKELDTAHLLQLADKIGAALTAALNPEKP